MLQIRAFSLLDTRLLRIYNTPDACISVYICICLTHTPYIPGTVLDSGDKIQLEQDIAPAFMGFSIMEQLEGRSECQSDKCSKTTTQVNMTGMGAL